MVSGVAFVRRQLARGDPLLDLRLFRSRVVRAAISANLLSIAALTGLLLITSQYLQLVLGVSPLDAGLLLVPGLVVSVLAGLAAVPLARRPGALAGRDRPAAGRGRLRRRHPPGARLRLALVVVAFALVAAGAGLAETLTNDAILTAAPPERAGQASAVSETAYELGTGLGVAVLGSVLGAVYTARLVLPAVWTPARGPRPAPSAAPWTSPRGCPAAPRPRSPTAPGTRSAPAWTLPPASGWP